MNFEEIKEKMDEAFTTLQKLNSAFDPTDVEDNDVWYENLEDPEWFGRVPYGSLNNYIIFIEKKEDGLYVSMVVETEPLMIVNDWLFGNPIKPSDLDYEFSGSAFDAAADYSHDSAKSIWEEKL